MDEESALAPEAGPEVIEAVEGETTPEIVEGDQPEATPEEKSERAKRRDRDKASRQRIVEERNAAQARVAELEAARQKIIDAGKAKSEPTEADHPDPFDLQTARTLWGVRRELRENAAEEVAGAANAAKSQVENLNQQERVVIAEAWAVQVAEAKTRYADFEKVAHFAPISDGVAELVATSDMGADVAYYLGQHHAKAREISAMPLVEAARELGRIEARLSLPKPRTETNAPSPINPVRGSAGATRSTEKMSYLEFKAHREAGGTIR